MYKYCFTCSTNNYTTCHVLHSGYISSLDTVRLINGNRSCEGRVEVCHDDQWGTVCDDFWGLNDARVTSKFFVSFLVIYINNSYGICPPIIFIHLYYSTL